MGREELEVLKRGIVKRRFKRKIGLFIHGVGLDRATRRLDKKVDIGKVVSSLTSGIEVEIARYYTLVPYEDDARQLAFLDAIERAGLNVVSKRLPPKGVQRQVSMDVHMAMDIASFCYGHFEKTEQAAVAVNDPTAIQSVAPAPAKPEIKRIACIVCPSRELSYAIYCAHNLGIETMLCDFGLYGQSDGWTGVDKWIDLSTSETIWRD